MTKEFKQKYNLLGLLLVFCVAGCEAQKEGTVSLYPILDSGMTASSDSADKLYWMDNDRVIFVSYGPKPKTVAENQKRKPAIYIWDTRDNKVEKYTDGRQLCYHEGYIRYAGPDRFPVPGTKYFVAPLYEGPIGQENITNAQVFEEGSRKTESGPKYNLNPYECRLVEKPDSMDGKVWLPLLEQHGALLELDTLPEEIERAQPVVYQRASDKKMISLDIKRDDVGSISPRYYMEYRDAYFFHEPTTSSEKLNEIDCIRYWWMSDDGKIEGGCQSILPFKTWNTGMWLFPTSIGVLVTAGKIGDYDAGTAGYYHVTGDQIRKIVPGWLHNPRLSRDGCKLAYAHTPFLMARRVGSPGETKLKMTNLCSNGGNKK